MEKPFDQVKNASSLETDKDLLLLGGEFNMLPENDVIERPSASCKPADQRC